MNIDNDTIVIGNTFTIQNVPIKLQRNFVIKLKRNYLQYKMFLLNSLTFLVDFFTVFIYNTKCSY